MKKSLKQLTNEWRKAKDKANKFDAKEFDLRLQIDTLLAQDNKQSESIVVGTSKVSFTRKLNYSIPKAAITDIKANIPKDIFTDAFTTSYSLKPAVYNELKGKAKKIIEAHLTVKASPLSVSIKEV